MTTGDRLIILNTTRTGEKSLVVHALSRAGGRRGYIVSADSRSGALWQPLNILDAEVVENPRSELCRLRGVSVIHPLEGLRSNLYKSAIGMFISEVMWRLVREGQPEESLWSWLEGSILTLNALKADFSNYHLRFLLELCSTMGFSPSREGLEGYAGRHIGKICEMASSDLAGAMMVPLNGGDRSEIAGILLKYLGDHCETSLNIRSLQILKEIFRD